MIQQQNDIASPFVQRGVEDRTSWPLIPKAGQKLVEESVVALNVIDDVDLGEEHKPVKYSERPIVQHSGEDHVSKILDPEQEVNLRSYAWIPDLDYLTEFGDIREELAVGGFKMGKVWIIWS